MQTTFKYTWLLSYSNIQNAQLAHMAQAVPGPVVIVRVLTRVIPQLALVLMGVSLAGKVTHAMRVSNIPYVAGVFNYNAICHYMYCHYHQGLGLLPSCNRHSTVAPMTRYNHLSISVSEFDCKSDYE